MPTQAQAGLYSAIRHKAIAAAGTDEAKAVMAKIRRFLRSDRLREDGPLVHDMYFAEVKKPAESRGPGTITTFSA